jgi:hypothetical protein
MVGNHDAYFENRSLTVTALIGAARGSKGFPDTVDLAFLSEGSLAAGQ